MNKMTNQPNWLDEIKFKKLYKETSIGNIYETIYLDDESKQQIIQHIDEMFERVIGYYQEIKWNDESSYCETCNFQPTDGSKMCICKYKNGLKRVQYKRKQQELKALRGE